MNKKICNEKQTISPSIKEFNDRDMLQDCLDSLKHLGTKIGTLATEASNKDLLSTVESVEKNIKKITRESFDLLFQLGWYTLEEENSTQIKDAHKQFCTYFEEQLQ